MTVPWKNIDLSWVERRLRSASDSTDSVHTLSAWALKNKEHYQLIVDVWLKVLKTVSPEQRVVLFYLVNEVVQTCHKKNAMEFKDSFKHIFMEAIPHVRLPEIKNSIERILVVWLQREVYDPKFVNQLIILLNDKNYINGGEVEEEMEDNESDILEDVKALDVKAVCMRVRRLEDDLSLLEDEGFNFVPSMSLDDVERTDCSDETLERLQLFISQLEELVATREKLLTILNSAACILHLEGKEANIVASAYKNYAGRIATVKLKLKDKVDFLKATVKPKISAEDTNSMFAFKAKQTKDASMATSDVKKISSAATSITESVGTQSYGPVFISIFD